MALNLRASTIRARANVTAEILGPSPRNYDDEAYGPIPKANLPVNGMRCESCGDTLRGHPIGPGEHNSCYPT